MLIFYLMTDQQSHDRRMPACKKNYELIANKKNQKGFTETSVVKWRRVAKILRIDLYKPFRLNQTNIFIFLKKKMCL